MASTSAGVVGRTRVRSELMYGYPEDFDTRAFIGRQLTSVLFAENLISFMFEDDLLITAQTSVSYRLSPDEMERTDTPPVSTTMLVGLVGRVVTGGSLVSPKELVLAFDHGAYLRFADDSDMYESFTFRNGDIETFV